MSEMPKENKNSETAPDKGVGSQTVCSATELAEANKEINRLKQIIERVWKQYDDESKVWWDSDLLYDLQEIAEQ